MSSRARSLGAASPLTQQAPPLVGLLGSDVVRATAEPPLSSPDETTRRDAALLSFLAPPSSQAAPLGFHDPVALVECPGSKRLFFASEVNMTLDAAGRVAFRSPWTNAYVPVTAAPAAGTPLGEFLEGWAAMARRKATL